ncbi:receptor-binding cancer antigen expressed on SiSo cells [Diprion similis]|uniref:receptor-binding cancer antigen expressed on SiSo cells n=1 Tax=Diprion similis TaxID=362088 RepID=UPI001EF8EEB7|nr:receptor-binding cancer antigen expressed on SiSo cells [Diprion similis]XP_046745267.1 receptor-binding cancer antigen expressed on SiSo cells [Diprion similis]
MALQYVMNRIKALFLIIFGVFRRAMCCFRKRRRSSCESIPLSAIGVVPNNVNNHTELEQWTQWEDNPIVVVPDKPENIIQAKIEQYRQQVAKPPDPPNDEVQPDFFEDMTPKITKQTKILIKNKPQEEKNWNTSKFAVIADPVPTNELGEWEDNTAGWEKETVKELGDPTEALREQKRKERQQRMLEQQQRRMDRTARPQPLGAKIAS